MPKAGLDGRPVTPIGQVPNEPYLAKLADDSRRLVARTIIHDDYFETKIQQFECPAGCKNAAQDLTNPVLFIERRNDD
jgi:hypothetical protein